jgi:hypothetical protein
VRSHDPAWWNRSIGPPWTPASCSFPSDLSPPAPAKTLAVAMPERARTNVTPNARTPRLARLTRSPSDSSSVDWFGLPVNRPIGHFVSRTTYYAPEASDGVAKTQELVQGYRATRTSTIPRSGCWVAHRSASIGNLGAGRPEGVQAAREAGARARSGWRTSRSSIPVAAVGGPLELPAWSATRPRPRRCSAGRYTRMARWTGP